VEQYLHSPNTPSWCGTYLSSGTTFIYLYKNQDEVGGTWDTHGGGRGVYSVLVGRPKGKRSLRRPRCRWEDNIKMDLREIGIDGANWIHLA
jgi:hypothetical protein